MTYCYSILRMLAAKMSNCLIVFFGSSGMDTKAKIQIGSGGGRNLIGIKRREGSQLMK